MNLKTQLAHYLKLRGLTAAELARQASATSGRRISRQTMSDWLAGRSVRNLDHLMAVAKVLQVSVDELLSEAEPVTRPKVSVLDVLMSDEEWISGVFEIKIRRLKEK